MALRGKKIDGLSFAWLSYFMNNGGLVKVAKGLHVAPATLRKYARGQKVKQHVSARLSAVEGLPTPSVAEDLPKERAAVLEQHYPSHLIAKVQA